MSDLDNELYTVSDYSHIGWAYLTVYTTFVWGGFHHACLASLIVIVVGAVKEYWYDERFESVEVRGSNTRDWLGYCLGAGVAVLSLYIRTQIS